MDFIYIYATLTVSFFVILSLFLLMPNLAYIFLNVVTNLEHYEIRNIVTSKFTYLYTDGEDLFIDFIYGTLMVLLWPFALVPIIIFMINTFKTQQR